LKFTLVNKQLLTVCLTFICSIFWGNEVERSVSEIIATNKADTSQISELLEISNANKKWETQRYIASNDSLIAYLRNQLKSASNQALAQKIQEGLVKVYKNNAAFFKSKAQFDDATYYYEIADSLSQKYLLHEQQAGIYIEMGVIYGMQSKFDQSTFYTSEALRINKELNRLSQIADAQNNLGVINYYKGDYATAQKYWNDALASKEIIGDSSTIPNTMLNIGNIKKVQKEYDAAIKLYESAKEYYVNLNNQRGLAVVNNNLGGTYETLGEHLKALEYFKDGLTAAQNLNDNFEIADALGALGSCFQNLGRTEEAIQHLEMSIKLCEISGNNKSKANAHLNLAKALENNQPEEALKNAQISMELSKEYNLLPKQKNTHEFLWKFHKNQRNEIAALKNLETFLELKDSLESKDQKSELVRLQFQFEFDKKIASDSIAAANYTKIKDAEILAEKSKNQKHKAEAQKQDQLKYFLIALLGVSSLFGFFIFQRLKLIRRQKGIIEKQKAQVDESYKNLNARNKEILDSIVYAKRIQNAILPPLSEFEKHLSESFVLYQPKDVVAGDFYWVEKIGNKVFFAACDCTGHGVPGAMVSVICKNALTRAVREFGLTDPEKILDKTKEIVIGEFEKSDDQVKDGMDMALCVLEGNQLQFSGANNPLWLLRKDATEIEVHKGDKQPIGKYVTNIPFQNHTIHLEEGDSIYLFTDGLIDQFGGKQGKKFKASNFKKLIMSIANMDMKAQKESIYNTFETWKGDMEQIDDICVLGYRYGAN